MNDPLKKLREMATSIHRTEEYCVNLSNIVEVKQLARAAERVLMNGLVLTKTFDDLDLISPGDIVVLVFDEKDVVTKLGEIADGDHPEVPIKEDAPPQ